MRRVLLFLISFATACSATCITAADADAAPRSNASSTAQQAQQWFTRGVASARAGDHAAARRAFALAHALVPSVDILWNLATAERLAGDSVAAVQHLRMYVASADARADRKKLAEDELLPELESVTARLRIDEPEGAVVIVDGKEVPRVATIDVAPGVHAIVVRRDGSDGERAFATVATAGTTTALAGEPAAVPSAIAPPTSAAAPVPPPPIAPIPITPSSSAPVEIATRAPGRTTAVLALGGVALATLATGIVFAIVAREDQADADRLEVRMRDDDRTCKRAGTLCADYESATNAAQRSMLLSSTLIATGGLFGGAALASWILWPTSTTRVVPVAGKDVAGLGVSGRF